MEKISNTRKIFEFYNDNYDKKELVPDKKFIEDHQYFYIEINNAIVAMVGIQDYYNKIAEVYQLVVVKEYRRKGIATKLIKELEDYLRGKNYTKILTWIITDNIPSLFAAIKADYLIEGLARGNLENTNVYLLGKQL